MQRSHVLLMILQVFEVGFGRIQQRIAIDQNGKHDLNEHDKDDNDCSRNDSEAKKSNVAVASIGADVVCRAASELAQTSFQVHVGVTHH